MVYFRIICYIHSLARGNNSKSIRKLLVDKRSQTNLMFFLFPPSFVLIVSMGVLPIWHRILWWRAVLWGQPTLLFLVFLKTCSCCNFFSKSSVHLKNSLKWHTKMKFTLHHNWRLLCLDMQKKKCKYSYLNFKSHYEVWVNFILGHAYSPWPFNTVKF